MTTLEPIHELVQKLEAAGFIYEPSKRALKDILLGIPSKPPAEDLFVSIFADDYEPGTFLIEERRSKPPFICVEDDSSLEDWVVRETKADFEKILPRLEENCPWQLPSLKEIDEIPYKAIDVLEYTFGGECKLTEEIYQQEYTDVLRRINLIYLTGWPRLPFNEYDAINHQMFPLGIELAKRVGELDQSTLLKVSVATGLVGLNHKTNASATSLIYTKNIIATDFDVPPTVVVNTVYSSLLEKCQEGWAIDGEDNFIGHILDQSQQNSLVFFPDDLLETLIDLKLMERLLHINPHLTIFAIPRAVRVGNDAGAQDVYHAMQESVFSKLAQFHREGRFNVITNGPLSGNVNGRRLSAPVLDLIYSANYVLAKGARSFECLQGLKKDSFFGFAVCRSISESVTGIDAETGGLVLIYQKAGQKSFEGFRNRHLRSKQFSSGRRAWLASRTALDS